MIPQEKIAAVDRAVHEAFGATAIENIRQITTTPGSDVSFRIVVQGSPYLLRIMTRTDERMDPGRIFACTTAAAQAGVAPGVRYSNVDDGILITDLVEAVPFPVAEALVRLPGTLQRLHALPPFPKAFNYVTAHNGFIWRLRQTPLVPTDELEEVFTKYERVCAVYPRLDSDLVSCHMDLKPDNIVFDGHRVWLVNWNAAFVNDRYFDLSVAANFVVTDDADESTYLERYFGQPPDAYERARFFLMRQVVHMLSAAVFVMLGSASTPIGQRDTLPTFVEFHERMWAGEINPMDGELKLVYGLLHWERLLDNVRRTRCDEALAIVSERNRSQEGVRLLLPSPP
jgi:hypothetical protein